jgi:hypothetical protein
MSVKMKFCNKTALGRFLCLWLLVSAGCLFALQRVRGKARELKFRRAVIPGKKFRENLPAAVGLS